MLRKKRNNTFILINFICLTILIFGVVLSLMPFVSTTTKRSVPNLFGNSIVIVNSDSMLPEFKNNQIIIVSKTKPENIKIGDKIAYYIFYENGSIAKIEFHEVVQKMLDSNDKYFFEVKGTANLNLEQKLVHQDSIIGKNNKNANSFAALLTFSFSTIGIVILIILPIIALMISQVLFSMYINIDKEKKNKHETNNK